MLQPFIDWVSFTVHPDSSLPKRLVDTLDSQINGQTDYYHDPVPTTVFTCNGQYGLPAIVTIRSDKRGRYVLIQIRGNMLHVLRSFGLTGYVLQLFLEEPHKQTRTDITVDRKDVAPSSYGRVLHRLKNKGHREEISLSRKSVPKHKVKPMIYPRSLDGLMSGSVMFNHRGDRYSAIVYDKREQIFAAHGIDILEESLRYEIRTTEATLHDIFDPAPLFYRTAAPGLLRCPSGIEKWEPRTMQPLDLPKLTPKTDAERIYYGITDDPGVQRLLKLLETTDDKNAAAWGINRLRSVLDDLSCQTRPNFSIVGKNGS